MINNKKMKNQEKEKIKAKVRINQKTKRKEKTRKKIKLKHPNIIPKMNGSLCMNYQNNKGKKINKLKNQKKKFLLMQIKIYYNLYIQVYSLFIYFQVLELIIKDLI